MNSQLSACITFRDPFIDHHCDIVQTKCKGDKERIRKKRKENNKTGKGNVNLVLILALLTFKLKLSIKKIDKIDKSVI